jgi:hypothetical protein
MISIILTEIYHVPAQIMDCEATQDPSQRRFESIVMDPAHSWGSGGDRICCHYNSDLAKSRISQE